MPEFSVEQFKLANLCASRAFGELKKKMYVNGKFKCTHLHIESQESQHIRINAWNYISQTTFEEIEYISTHLNIHFYDCFAIRLSIVKSDMLVHSVRCTA